MARALITGASRGIGAAIARRFAADGHDLVLHAHRHADEACALAKALEAGGARATVRTADLADPEAAWRLGEEAVAELGGLDLLVHNAGVYDRTSLEGMDGATWRRGIDVNLTAPAVLTQAVQGALRAAGGQGAVVFVSSIAAFRGSAHGAQYSAAKAGLLGLARSLALELAPVRVNAVAPGYIDTDMLAGDDPARRRQREAEVPVGRVGAPEDIAGCVAFLCGPDAAYVTGQVLHANGGLWMG